MPAIADAAIRQGELYSGNERLSFARENLRDEVLDSLQDGLPPKEILGIVQRALGVGRSASKRVR